MDTTSQPSDASEALNVVTVAATRTRAALCDALNSTTPEVNEKQRANIFTGVAQRASPQWEQPVDTQVNNYDDDVDEPEDVLSHNLEGNDFENVENYDDFYFNTKKLNKILCHIVNENLRPVNFVIENMTIP